MTENITDEIEKFPVFKMMGDSDIIVYIGSTISPEINDKVHYLVDSIKNKNWIGIKEIIPSYVSLSIHYDPFIVDYTSLEGFVRKVLEDTKEIEYSPKRKIVIPTFYEGEYAPDMESVSAITGLSDDKIIKMHTSIDYKVYSIGFTPGFPYLGNLDQKLHCPRLDSPRVAVPRGSVAIAESQTGIYPNESPGGWRIIGTTPVSLFDSTKLNPALLKPGDLVKFKPLSDEKEFAYIKENCINGDYEVEEILS